MIREDLSTTIEDRMPTISIYTFVRNGLFFDFHVVEMLRHHLPLADQIVVNEGYSTDGTYEAIEDLDPRIEVYRNRWDESDPKTWSMKFKDQARRCCSGDWCILLDIDEFIPEWEFPRIRDLVAQTDKFILPLKYVHFYGNYKVFNSRPDLFHWPVCKHTIHRNIATIEVWGDGSNVGFCGQLDMSDPRIEQAPVAEVHHFGTVRQAARLRQKWRAQQMRNARNRWDFLPSLVYDLMPHRWDDPELLPHLAVHNGPFLRAVRENPSEFVRDDFFLFEMLSSNARRSV